MYLSSHHQLAQFALLLFFIVNNIHNIKSRTSHQLCQYSEIDPELRYNRVLDKKYQIKLDNNENLKYFIPGDTYTSEYISTQ